MPTIPNYPEVQVPVKSIEIPKRDLGDPKTGTEAIQRLAASIVDEGLHQPIGVRNHPTEPGRKILVFGRARLAAFKALKRDEIPARDFGDMDDKSDEMAACSENLFRKSVNKGPWHALLRVWAKHHQEKYPEIKPGAAGSKAAQRTYAERRGEQPTPEPDPDPDKPKPLPLAESVAAATGISVDNAKENLRIARSFEEDQLQAMAFAGTTNKDMLKIIKATSDKDLRRQIVNLTILRGDADAAIKEVLADPLMEAKPAVTVKPEPAPETTPTEPEPDIIEESSVPDDQWLAKYCFKIREPLGENTAAFDRAALTYRHTTLERQRCRKALKKTLLANKREGTMDAMAKRIHRFTHIEHPNDWIRCGTCTGSGERDGARCNDCYGDGFKITTENIK